MKNCQKCAKEVKKQKRGYCYACYERLRRNGLIEIINDPVPQKLNKIQKQYLIGSMLGDGHLDFQEKAANCRLHIVRKLDDIEYLKLEAKIFDNLCKINPIKVKDIFDKRTNKTYHQSYFRTRNCPALNDFYKIWYDKNGVKILPKNLQLTPLILLIWFLDDGFVSIKVKKDIGRLNLVLNTQSFSKQENLYLAKLLSNFTGGYYFGVHKSRKQFCIQCSDGAARAFLKIIDNIFPDCMLRKAVWRQSEVKFYDPNIKIYKSLLLRGEISDLEADILCFIKNNNDITCKEILPNFTIIGRTRLQQYLKKFKDKGYVKVIKRSGNSGGFIYNISQSGIKVLKEFKSNASK
jgi:LAGLIDADG DNA endonuclease family protein